MWNLTWNSYVDGFHTPTPPYNLSFWIGLKALEALMGPEPVNIGIQISFYPGSSVPSFSHRYTGVVIGNSTTNYMLTYTGHILLSNISEGDCLELSNMTSFSTWDADHDEDSGENWALRAGGGWWFPPSNFSCNPLGLFYGRKMTPPTDDGYIRFPGVDNDDTRNYFQKIDMYIEDDYV